jgi:hypothetical protein
MSPACDNATIFKQLLNIWDRLAKQNKVNNVHQVVVSLTGLIEKPRQLTFDDIVLQGSRRYQWLWTISTINMGGQ